MIWSYHHWKWHFHYRIFNGNDVTNEYAVKSKEIIIIVANWMKWNVYFSFKKALKLDANVCLQEFVFKSHSNKWKYTLDKKITFMYWECVIFKSFSLSTENLSDKRTKFSFKKKKNVFPCICWAQTLSRFGAITATNLSKRIKQQHKC